MTIVLMVCTQQIDKLVFIGLLRAAPCLPLWGRWQPEGLTEEVFGCRFAEKSKKRRKPLPTSLRSATLPKGEGKDTSNANLSFR